jgi:hypothetical protein
MIRPQMDEANGEPEQQESHNEGQQPGFLDRQKRQETRLGRPLCFPCVCHARILQKTVLEENTKRLFVSSRSYDRLTI